MAVIVLELKCHCAYRASLLRCLTATNTPFTLSYEEYKESIYTVARVTVTLEQTYFAELSSIIMPALKRWSKQNRFIYNAHIVQCSVNDREVWNHGL